jgi:hypothetical protein
MKGIYMSKSYIGGIIGADPVFPSDEHWDAVELLLDGSSTTDDLSTANNDTSIYVNTNLTGSTVSAGSIDGTLNVPYLEFNTDDGVAIPTSFDLSGGDWTIEMWVYFDTVAQYKPLISSAVAATGMQVSLAASPNEDTLTIGLSGGTSLLAAQPVSPQTWHHVALSYVASNQTLHLFVDGVGASSSSSYWATLTSNYLGGASQDTNVYNQGHILVLGVNRNNNQAFDGRMTGVRATKGVARYTSNFTPPDASFPTTSSPIRPGVSNLGSLGGDGASTTKPTRRWGGITGRSLVDNNALPTTGVLSLAEHHQSKL